MPPEGIPAQPKDDYLTNGEIIRLVEIAAEQGVRRVRLTGGEPLLRREIVSLVEGLSNIPDLQEVTLTTNGILLKKYASLLANVGLKRVNVSLDTLDAHKFTRITRGGKIERVFDGIAAVEIAGLTPIKINTVAIKGVNDEELESIARLSLENDWHVRFIELMPLGNLHDWGQGFPPYDERYLPISEIKKKLAKLNLQPEQSPVGNGPAKTYRIPGSLGTVGFISPLGDHFCGSCNRLRLTGDGNLRPCLLMDKEIPIRSNLRNGDPILPLIKEAIDARPKGHEILQGNLPELRRMVQIGG
jgi:cyclic pyranopterin phosphate synthase